MDRKTIFITGAASGIGKATALYFASKGYYLGLYDIDLVQLEKVHRSIGEARSCYRRLDVSNADDVGSAFDHFSSFSQGRLDVLLNSAGVLHISPFQALNLQLHQQILEVNNKGTLNCCYHAFDQLRKTPGSYVVNLSSASAVYGVPDLASYSASKFWIRGFTEALNIEWAQADIHVCDIMPFFVDTAMIRNAQHAPILNRSRVILTAQDIAKIVWKAVHSKKVHWPVGIESIAGYHAPLGIVRTVLKLLSGYTKRSGDL